MKHTKKALRGFGSEVMSAVAKLALFMRVVCDPLAVLPRHSDLLGMARRVLDLLLLGDAVVVRLADLDHALRDFHTLFLELHPQCMKPKMHLARHLPEMMARHKINISCLPAERKHKRAKQHAQHLFQCFHTSLLRREVHAMVASLGEARIYDEERLGQREAPLGDLAVVGVLRRANLLAPIASAPSAQAGLLEFHKDDLVCWVDGHAVCVGRAYCFVRDARLVHLAVIWRYKQAAGVWCSDGADLRVLPLKALLAPLAYARLSHNVFHVLQPAWL